MPRRADVKYRDFNLPTRSQLQAEAFGLAPRTPEWLRAVRFGRPKPQPAVPPSADDTWVVAASRNDGWQLEKAARIFSSSGIASEVDSRAGLLRVERCSLRAACNLLRVNRRELRLSQAAKERSVVDGVFFAVVGPPLLLSTITLALLAALMSDANGPNAPLTAAAFAGLCLSVFFIVRAGSAGLCWLKNRRPEFDSVRPGRDDADYPPAP